MPESALYLVVTGQPGDPDYRLHSVHESRATATKALTGAARIYEIDVELLAGDLSDAFAKDIDRHGLNLGRGQIAAALPAILAQFITPGPATPPEKMTHWAWFRSQSTEIGATAIDVWYWRCRTASNCAWGGPYPDAMQAKAAGMAHDDTHFRPVGK